MIYTFIADVFWSVILATFLSVLVEAPILGIEKIFMKSGGKSKSKEEEEPKEPRRIEFEEDTSLTKPLVQEENKHANDEL